MNNKNANELLNKIDKNYEQMSKGTKSMLARLYFEKL